MCTNVDSVSFRLRDRREPIAQLKVEKSQPILKAWCTFKYKQHFSEMKMIDRIVSSQSHALEQLRSISEDLYLSAIQVRYFYFLLLLLLFSLVSHFKIDFFFTTDGWFFNSFYCCWTSHYTSNPWLRSTRWRVPRWNTEVELKCDVCSLFLIQLSVVITSLFYFKILPLQKSGIWKRGLHIHYSQNCVDYWETPIRDMKKLLI